jgi:type IV secretion system protein VirD4
MTTRVTATWHGSNLTKAGSGVIGSDEADSILVGREMFDDGRAGDKVKYGGPLHAVLFGPNGVGKGMRLLVPNLLTIVGKSIVVIDPKGQLAAMTAKFRHQAGDDVKIIDPFGVLAEQVNNDPDDRWRYLREHGLVESAGFNPLALLDPGSDTFYDDAAVIADALIKVPKDDPHWAESAQGLVTGLVMWERMDRGADADLGNVRRLLTEADGVDDSGNLTGLRETAMRMVARGEREDGSGFEVASLGARFANAHTSDEIQSVRSTADTQTRWLLSRPMRDDLKKPGVDFSRLKTGDRPMTVYVVLPSKHLETHSVWLRLVVSEALRANLTAGGRRVLLILDEFAALGHLSIIQKMFGVTRDYRVQLWPVFQDLPQLKDLYPDRWETLLGMAGIVQTFRTGDLTTAEWVSKRAGQMTVMAESTNSSRSMVDGRVTQNSGANASPTGRPTIFAQDMFGLPDGYTVTFWQGERKPFPIYAQHFTQVASMRARTLPNPYYAG